MLKENIRKSQVIRYVCVLVGCLLETLLVGFYLCRVCLHDSSLRQKNQMLNAISQLFKNLNIFRVRLELETTLPWD